MLKFVSMMVILVVSDYSCSAIWKLRVRCTTTDADSESWFKDSDTLTFKSDSLGNEIASTYDESKTLTFSPSTVLIKSSLQKTSELTGYNYNEITRSNVVDRVRDLIEANVNDIRKSDVGLMHIFERVNILDFSSQQLQLINDMFSMLQQSMVYDEIQKEKNLHEKCFTSAFQDLNDAIKILKRPSQTGSFETNDNPHWRLKQAKSYVSSAIRHLQESCPLCRALKYAINVNEDDLLLFFTTVSASILKSIHPEMEPL